MCNTRAVITAVGYKLGKGEISLEENTDMAVIDVLVSADEEEFDGNLHKQHVISWKKQRKKPGRAGVLQS